MGCCAEDNAPDVLVCIIFYSYSNIKSNKVGELKT